MKEDRIKVLFDSNVIIDSITSRPNSNSSSREAFMMAVSGKIDGYLVSKQITDIYYVLRKYDIDIAKRKQFITLLLKAFQILPCDIFDLTDAIGEISADYEDGVLIHCAKNNHINAIVTNNNKHFITNLVNIYSPIELNELV